MSTVAQIYAMEQHQHAWVLFIDGVDKAFTTEPELEGSGASSWINTTWGAREVLGGLIMPSQIPNRIDPRTGKFEESTITLRLLEDEDETIAELFGTENVAREYIISLRSSEDPADATKLHPSAATSVNIRGRHVGVEAIGSGGERRIFHCFPFQTGVGGSDGTGLPLDHISRDSMNDPFISVSDEPVVFEGRWFALYRVVRDPQLANGDYQDWPNWEDQYNGGALAWWGRMKDRGSIDHKGGRIWSMDVSGPASLLDKRLNQAQANEQWHTVDTPLVLKTDPGQRNDHIAVGFYRFGTYQDSTGALDANVYDAGINKFGDRIQVTTPDDVADHIETVILSVADNGASVTDTGDTHFHDSAHPKSQGQRIEFDKNYIGIRRNREDDAVIPNFWPSFFAMELVLHEDIWQLLGWNIRYGTNKSFRVPDALVGQNQHELTDIFWVDFSPVSYTTSPPMNSFSIFGHGMQQAVGTGYIKGEFTTKAAGMLPGFGIGGLGTDNYGDRRDYLPENSLFHGGEGKQVRLEHTGRQLVELLSSRIYAESQKDRPPTGDSIAGGAIVADSTRRWVFRGKFKRGSADDETEEVEHHVAKCSWKDADGGVAEINGTPRLYIERWEDSRLYGFDNPPMDRTWTAAVASIQATPMSVWGYEGPVDKQHSRQSPWSWIRLEQSYSVMQRILLSTGTSSAWSGTEEGYGSATITAGDNDNGATGDIHAQQGNDLEIADMGLGIPEELVQSSQSFLDAFSGMESLESCKLCSIGDIHSETLLEALMQPAGLAWKLDRSSAIPQYGVFRVAQTLSPADLTIAITESDLHGDTNDPTSVIPTQQIRWASAIDIFNVGYRFNPADESNLRTYSAAARDDGARYRDGRTEHKINGGGLTIPELATELFTPEESAWQPDFTRIWGWEMAQWWASRHFLVTNLRIHRTKAWEIEVGTRILLTNVRLALPDGTYGLTNGQALIVSTSLDTASGMKTVEALVDVNSLDLRVWAPIARVLAYDASATKLKCDTDYWGRGATTDIEFFVNPSWSPFSDANASIQLWGFSRNTWETGPTGTVSSVNTSTQEITLTGALSATPDRDKIWFVTLREYDNQAAAWAKGLFSVVTNPEYDFGTGPTDGFKLL